MPRGRWASIATCLIAARRTESEDPFGNTFYSEINVIDADKPAPPPAIAPGSVKVSDKLALAMAERKAQKNLEAIKALVQEPGVHADAAQRAEILKKARPLLEPLDKNLAEIAKLAPDAKWRVDQLTAAADPIRVALGEKAHGRATCRSRARVEDAQGGRRSPRPCWPGPNS